VEKPRLLSPEEFMILEGVEDGGTLFITPLHPIFFFPQVDFVPPDLRSAEDVPVTPF